MKQNDRIKLLFCGLLLAISFIFVIRPLLHGGFFPTFDDVQVVRIDEMAKELSHGQFPVRYTNNLGNGGGYMFFNFYSPLVYYLGALIHIIGIPLVKTTKIVFILGYLVGALSMYFVLRRKTNLLSATLGTLLFLFSTYFSYEVYTRGTLAEFFALAISPLLFGSILELKEKPKFVTSMLVGILLAVLVYTHVFLALNIALIGMIIFLLPTYSVRRFIVGGIALLTGALLSISFWLPMLVEQKYTQYSASYFAASSYKTNLLSVLQLLGLEKIPWGIKPPILGIQLTIGIISSIIAIIWLKRSHKLFVYSIVGFVVSILLASNLSTIFWNSLSFLKMLQFPWRFLAGATLTAVFAISFFVNQLKAKFAIIFCLALILLTFYNIPYFTPSSYNYIATYTADDACSSTTWAAEYLPKWASVCLPKPKKQFIANVKSLDKTAKISNIKESDYGRLIEFKVVNKNNTRIIVRRYYFPGWMVTINGIKIQNSPYGKEGLISFNVSAGMNDVSVVWQGTLIEHVADLVNFISIVLILIMIIGYEKFKKLI